MHSISFLEGLNYCLENKSLGLDTKSLGLEVHSPALMFFRYKDSIVTIKMPIPIASCHRLNISFSKIKTIERVVAVVF